jgi:hypothetical protein
VSSRVGAGPTGRVRLGSQGWVSRGLAGCGEGAEPGEPGVQQGGPGADAGEVHDGAATGSGEPCGGREQPQARAFWVPDSAGG